MRPPDPSRGEDFPFYSVAFIDRNKRRRRRVCFTKSTETKRMVHFWELLYFFNNRDWLAYSAVHLTIGNAPARLRADPVSTCGLAHLLLFMRRIRPTNPLPSASDWCYSFISNILIKRDSKQIKSQNGICFATERLEVDENVEIHNICISFNFR